MKGLKKHFLTVLLLSIIVFLTKTDALAVSNAKDVIMDGETWVTQTLAKDDTYYWYRVVVPSDGRLDMTFQAFREDTYWHFVDADLNDSARYFRIQINNGSINSPGTANYSIYLSKGTYYIKAADNLYGAYSGSGDIRIKCAFTSAKTTETEPNDTWTEAMPLASGKTVRGILTARDDREDFYKIQVTKTGEVKIKMTAMFDSCLFQLYTDEYISAGSGVFYNASETSPKAGEWKFDLTPGTYYIKMKDNTANADPCGIYEISWEQIIPVEAISLSSQAMTLTEGDQAVLTATVLPEAASNKEVSWSSSNSGIVSVDEKGNLTANKSGTAVITVKANDGSEVTASCNITVREKIYPPAQVTGLAVKEDSQKTTSLTLTWNEVSGAEMYRVYKYDANKQDYVVYKDTASTTLKVTKLKAETAYLFKVVAYKQGYDELLFGESSLICKAYTAPKKLKAATSITKKTLKKTAKKQVVQLKWKKVSGASGYRIYCKQAGSSWKLLKKTKTNKVKLTLVKNKNYSFRIETYRTKNRLTTVGKKSKIVKYSTK